MTLEAWAWVLLGALFVGSGLASGSETAMTSVNMARARARARQGSKRARNLLHTLHHQERILAAILLANNCFNLALSSLATALLLPYVTAGELALIMLGITLLLVLFAEIVPKTIALQYADTLAPWIAPAAMGLSRLTEPLFLVVSRITRLLRRKPASQSEAVHRQREILEGAIDMHAAESGDHHERSVLHSVLEIGDVEVSEAMTHRSRVYTVDIQSPDAMARLLRSPYRHVPLFRDDPENICAVVDTLSMLKKLKQRQVLVSSVLPQDILQLAQEPWFVPATTSVLTQLRRFRGEQRHFALVVDEYGSFEGVITVQNILDEVFGHHQVEEIPSSPTENVQNTAQNGSINGEGKDVLRLKGIRHDGRGQFIIDGDVTLRTLNRELNWKIDDEDTHTIAGYVIGLARRIPSPGDCYKAEGLAFEVLERQRNRISAIRVTTQEN